MIKRSKLISLQLILAGLGMLLSMYMMYIHATSNSVICTSTCESVITGKYGEFLGQPWGLWGLLFYTGMAVILVLRSKNITKIFDITVPFGFDVIFRIGLVTGWAITLYLRYLEFFVLHELCFWCWMSVVIMLLLTVTEIVMAKTSKLVEK